MINFIVCDDNKKQVTEINNIIDKCMINNELDYKKHNFSDYDKAFKKIVKEKLPSKIYILDIETPSASGIDIARLIRKDDVNSVIIFLTGHNELGDLVLKNDLLFLSFINKFDNYKSRLERSIKKSLKIVGSTQALTFKDNGIICTISLKDIYYIKRNKIERKTLIKTDYKDFIINKALKDISKELNSEFIYTHKSCIVNKEKISAVDKKKKEIVFNNGETIDLVSKKYVNNI